MAARIISTLIALLLAAGAYFGVAPGTPGINLVFVLFLFVAFILWFEWESIEAGYSYLREREGPRGKGLQFPLTRLAPLLRGTPSRDKADGEEPPPAKKPDSDPRRRRD
jgi:hypothetical protein